MRRVTLLAGWSLALAACGGGGDDAPAAIDAPAVIDAAAGDGPLLGGCYEGGSSTVTLDPGGGAAPITYATAWFNHGHGTKACFAIDVVLSTATTIDSSYLQDDRLLELQFQQAPVVGANLVHAHQHAGDRWFDATVTLSIAAPTETAGATSGGSGGVTLTGSFVAPPCAAIFDPCI